MKSIAAFSAVACLFALTATRAWAGPEELAIEKTITGEARAVTDFPRTRDMQSVFRFYTKDYSAIQDGVSQTLKDVEKELSEFREQMDLGAPVGMSAKVTNITSHVSGNVAWATYDFTHKIGTGGEALLQMEGKCTTVLQKQGTTWLMQHEHCSTQHKEEPEDKDSDP